MDFYLVNLRDARYTPTRPRISAAAGRSWMIASHSDGAFFGEIARDGEAPAEPSEPKRLGRSLALPGAWPARSIPPPSRLHFSRK